MVQSIEFLRRVMNRQAYQSGGSLVLLILLVLLLLELLSIIWKNDRQQTRLIISQLYIWWIVVSQISHINELRSITLRQKNHSECGLLLSEISIPQMLQIFWRNNEYVSDQVITVVSLFIYHGELLGQYVSV